MVNYGGLTPVVLGPSGDQSGVTDAAAIQALWNAHVPVLLQANAIYYVSATLNPTGVNNYLIGEGWYTQIMWDGGVIPSLVAMGDTTQRRVFIQNLRLSQSNVASLGTCLNINYFVDSVIDQVLIDNGGGSGANPNIGISGAVVGTEYNVISNSRIACGGTNGIAINWDSAANSNTVRDCRILLNNADATNTGIFIGTAHAIKIDHIDVESALGTALHISGTASDVTVEACYFEANGTNIQIDAGARGIIITGGYNALATTANLVNNADPTGVIYLGGRVGNNAYSHLSLINVDKFSVNSLQVPANTFQPEDNNFLSWAYDPYLLTATTVPTAGTLLLVKLNFRYATTVSKIWAYIGTPGTGVVASENFLGLFSSAGTLLSSTAAGAIDAQVGSVTGAFSGTLQAAQTMAAGTFGWAAILFNAAGMPTLGRSATAPGAGNANLTAANFRSASNGTSLIALPGSITPSSNVQTGDQAYWAAAS